jgi:hypothetical protein
MIATSPGVAYTVVDPSGRYAPAIKARIQHDNDRDVLDELASYAARWKIAPPGAVWAGGERAFSDAEVARFEAAGGLAAAQSEIARLKPKNAPDFKPPKTHVVFTAPPSDVVVDQGPDRFGATLTPHLKADVPTSSGPRPLALAVYVPADLGQPGATVRMWTNGHPDADLIEPVREEISQVMRGDAIKTSGVDLATLARIQAVQAPISLTIPPTGSGRDRPCRWRSPTSCCFP